MISATAKAITETIRDLETAKTSVDTPKAATPATA